MTIAACPVDSRPVDPDTDHHGRPHGGERRRYCSVDCRRAAELERRRELRATRRQERDRRAALARAHAAEARGEVPLPLMPPLPRLDEETRTR